jgi:hypothetical protein
MPTARIASKQQTPAATGGAHGIETFILASNAKELE